MGGLFVPVEGPLVEHPDVPAYGGQWGSQLVACVGGEAPLAREGLFPAPESGIETRQQAVYGNRQASDLIFRVRNGQPLREIPLPHLPRRGSYGFDGPQGCPRQQVGAADGEEEGHADACSEDRPDLLYTLK